MADSGLRSSCEAEAANRRWRSAASVRRSSIRFNVAPRRPISESPPAGCTRRARSSAWMRSTSARISSTGAKARPVTHQMTIAASITITGSPIASPSRRCASARSAAANDVTA